MKNLRLLSVFIIVATLIASCSNSRYGHIRKGSKNQAVVKKHESKYKKHNAQAAEEVVIASKEEATTVAPEQKVQTQNTVVATAPVTKSVDAPKVKANKAVVTNSAITNVVTTKDTNLSKDIEDNYDTNAATNALDAAKKKGKSQLIALIICGLVGTLGIHRFYLGYTWQGVVQLLTAGGCGIWTLIDFIRIAMGTLKPKGGDYTDKL